MRALAIACAAWLGVVGALGAVGASGCGSRPETPDKPTPGTPTPDRPTPITEPADSCTTADDCALVDACCGCNAGGKKLAIRKDAVAGFEASRAQRCAEVMCAQMISTDPTCDAEPICGSRNRCRVAPHMQHQ